MAACLYYRPRSRILLEVESLNYPLALVEIIRDGRASSELPPTRNVPPHNSCEPILASTFQQSSRDLSQSYYYQYMRLRERKSIRVLELSPGTSTTPIQGRIQEVSLDDPISYDAVSYVWGSPKLSPIIYVNSKAMLVTYNCFQVLENLRDELLPRNYWIDACCINQTSTDERTHQLGIMGDVYSKAIRTVVWLGNAGVHDVEIMKMIRSHRTRTSCSMLISEMTRELLLTMAQLMN